MRISGKDLKGLPVETQSGTQLGKVAGMVIETSEHRVLQYVVKKSHSLAKILPAEMLVHVFQVIKVDTEKMVVEDGVVTEKAEAEARQLGKESPAGVPSAVTRSAEGSGK